MPENVEMDAALRHHSVVFSQSTKSDFLQYTYEHPSERRVSHVEKNSLIEWLTNPDRRPSSQKEYSRRNYAQRTFSWNDKAQKLLAITKNGGQYRAVVTEDTIADVVELVHNNNGHAGWDATWKDINTSYYGILRADVAFLLKRCQVCANDPRKRSKGPLAVSQALQSVDQSALSFLSFDEFFSTSTLEGLENEDHPSV
ncbi:hypothetical protein BDV95DRAFT_600502 [Massariosphaeria phaeospora]|uniref:Integrase zinc-binding domain-containing protein n=1 Tax=Massariosphaeria phaeospora TaxID=100035 RepID=A0A7C8MDI3_9PLEO|nr:hypothetical protein BDV95DRAFT_600502 [Massariosphaeria phaeospora]